MRDSSDAADDVVELRKRFAEDGYLYMKGYLDRDQVLEARAALTDRLAAAGVLDENHPAIEGIAKPNSGYVFKPEITNGCEPVQRLLYSGRLIEFYKKFYAEDVRHYDYTWLRAIGPGKGTNPHCDLPYMGRGTHKHMTCWLPYGETSYELGGLMVLEGSHKRMDLLEKYVYRDVDAFCENKNADVAKVKEGKWTFTGTLSHNPPAVRNKFGGRWMVTEYEPGDFLTFGMFLVHASLDNQTTNRLRISSDSRYQRASEPIDERWVGVNPPAHGPNGKRGLIC
jgi:ectoine hydroxylase-related dioxygenase (phytanoyl-CoA dioxygenase family)